jgi:hypothetical protein
LKEQLERLPNRDEADSRNSELRRKLSHLNENVALINQKLSERDKVEANLRAAGILKVTLLLSTGCEEF